MGEAFKFVNTLLKTGKVILDCPTDCFLWTGTERELKQFMKQFPRTETPPLRQVDTSKQNKQNQNKQNT